MASETKPSRSLQRMVRPHPPWMPGYVNGKPAWVRMTPWNCLKRNLRLLPYRVFHVVTLNVFHEVILMPQEPRPDGFPHSKAETQPL